MIINLTQHKATDDQVRSGVVDLNEKDAKQIRDLLTFENIPSEEEIIDRASKIATYAYHWFAHDEYQKEAMIGGAPFLMGQLEKKLLDNGIVPLYAFSKRETIDKKLDDGSVTKINKFRHIGFVASTTEV